MFGRRARNPDLEDVAPSRARHLPSGAEVFTKEHDVLGYSLSGRTWSPYVERLTDGDVVYVAERPVWDDGTSVTTDELQQASAIIAAVLHHWGDERVEIVDGQGRVGGVTHR